MNIRQVLVSSPFQVSVKTVCVYGCVLPFNCALLLLVISSASPVVVAMDFRAGDVEGLLDIDLAYGNMTRVQSRDEQHIAVVNGGTGDSANIDDGNLNYDTGLVSNMVRATGELTMRWRNFGLVVRGYALYDYENETASRARTPLSAKAKDQIGLDAGLLEHYLSVRFNVQGTPMQIRLGDQIINWGETNFLREGIDVINPVDFLIPAQPAASVRDLRIPQGMLWGAANVTESIAVEAYYQYEWKGVELTPVGSYLSNNDLFGSDGLNFSVLGGGRISDLGTNLDTQFGLPAGTLGFDQDYLKIFGRYIEKPKDGGQYGFTVQGYLPGTNATKLAMHFSNYHARLPIISGLTANQAAIDSTSTDQVAENAAALAPVYEAGGLTPEEAAEKSLQTAEQLAVSNYANQAGYFIEHPEDIKVLGVSFNTATLRTGTLLAGDISHHFNFPFQIDPEAIFTSVLSPIEFFPSDSGSSLGQPGANAVIPGFVRLNKTQMALTLTQFFGPLLGAAQSVINLDGAWVHVHNIPDEQILPLAGIGNALPSTNSWGYRLVGQLTYTSILGGLNLSPSLAWTHDVDGITPGPAGAFVEGRKSISVGLGANYLNSWTANLSYTNFFGAGKKNLLNDRDFIRFRLAYSF